ncbi:hypothetical protein AO927_32210 [Pseudomonas aeruginosa]|nr:hypothetical protein AO927_32210 [Pseudomonas aeruginosa]
MVEPSISITPAGGQRRRRFRVKRRAPGSSERLHRSGERTHGQSVRLSPLPWTASAGSVGQFLRPALPSPRRQERDDKGGALGVLSAI